MTVRQAGQSADGPGACGFYSGPGTHDHVIRNHRGELVAIHRRRLDAQGRKLGLAWWSPDPATGALRLGLPPGISLRDLPLYGSDFASTWPREATILITEGEKACEALWRIGILAALGTATGAAITPSVDALHAVARGRRFVVWPDRDAAGEHHAANVAAALLLAEARSVSRVAYRADDELPSGWDAADLVIVHAQVPGVDTPDGRAVARAAVNAWWKSRVVPVTHVAKDDAGGPPARRRRESAGVSDLLRARFGVRAGPGKTVRCPKHGDRRPSLWVTRDDTRAICLSPACPWSYPGLGVAELMADTDVV
jgi:hypothetical protein